MNWMCVRPEHILLCNDNDAKACGPNGKIGLGNPMPALGDQLSDEEIEAVIAYLHTLWTAEQLETQQSITSRYVSP